MPYTIKKYKTGFRVYDNSNIPLSKKPLTKRRAQEQRIAVFLNESKKNKRLNAHRFFNKF